MPTRSRHRDSRRRDGAARGKIQNRPECPLAIRPRRTWTTRSAWRCDLSNWQRGFELGRRRAQSHTGGQLRPGAGSRASGGRLLRHAKEADPVAAAMDRALEEPRRASRSGRRAEQARQSCLASRESISGRVLSGEKPMTEELIERLAQSSDKIAMVLGSGKI